MPPLPVIPIARKRAAALTDGAARLHESERQACKRVVAHEPCERRALIRTERGQPLRHHRLVEPDGHAQQQALRIGELEQAEREGRCGDDCAKGFSADA